MLTPPFKPVVESDESTANFDPEFTSADMREVGVEDSDLDEEDPSEDWVTYSATNNTLGIHAYNGPLGSDRTNGAQHQNGATNGRSTQSIQIKKSKKKDVAGSPLTNSVQENFRGFTYHGGESLTAPGVLVSGLDNDGNDEAVAEEEVPEVTTEDEYEDSGSVGRYANARRKGVAWEDEVQV